MNTTEAQDLRLQQLPWQIRQSLVQQVDRVHGLRSAGVHILGSGSQQTLRASNGKIDVILELCMAAPSPTLWQKQNFWFDVVGATAACRATAAWGATAVSSAGVAPLTAGISTVVTGMAIAGAAASVVQCGNSLYRLHNHFLDPERNQELDANSDYRRSMLAVDVISITGGVATLIKAGSAAARLARSASRPWYRFHEPLNRAARRRLTKQLNIRASGAASGKQYKRMLRTGEIASKTYLQSEVTVATRRHLIDSITSGLSMLSSGTNGVLREIVVQVDAYIVEHSLQTPSNNVSPPSKTYLKQGRYDHQ
ncbi:MAG: hypothetical protein CME32_07305 [Gimesia sp.]|nr:hypothetical protein [Gimesia sp.]